METYKDAVVPKRRRSIRRMVVFAGILAVGATVYFFAFGGGNGFLKNNSAIIARSFREAFGLSLNGNSKEIVLGDHSSESSSIINKNDQTGGTDDANIAGNKPTGGSSKKNISDAGTRSGVPESSGGNSALEPEKDASSTEASYIVSSDESVPSGTPSDAHGTIMDSSDLISGAASVLALEVSAPSETSSFPAVLAPKEGSSKKTTATRCTFSAADAAAPTQQIVLNEVAWMGSPAQSGESAASASNNEWMEIKNEKNSTVSLAGWEIIDAAKNIMIVFGDNDSIAPSSFYLLERTDDNTVPGTPADKIYSGSLPNTGDTLGIFDGNCVPVDILYASDGWPGGDNGTKRTLERDHVGLGWHTSTDPGGTPKGENLAGSVAPIAFAPSVQTASPISTSATSSVPKYMVSVAIAGDGAGKVVSKPTGINCGFDCAASYSAGQTATLHAVTGANSVFSGWSGPCSGMSDCVFTVGGYVSAVATFHGAESVTASSLLYDTDDFLGSSSQSVLSSDAENETSSPDGDVVQVSSTSVIASGDATTLIVASDTPFATGVLAHVVIAAVQIAGASTTNDFVKIYNPETSAIDLSGWKLHKKSSTGADYSLKEMPAGSSVPAGGIFTWANSANGFSTVTGADVSSTETLSADNSVALFDASGAMVDAVAWGTGAGQYAEGAAYPDDPAANQVLTRIFQNGTIVDTDNNATDFVIQ